MRNKLIAILVIALLSILATGCEDDMTTSGPVLDAEDVYGDLSWIWVIETEGAKVINVIIDDPEVRDAYKKLCGDGTLPAIKNTTITDGIMDIHLKCDGYVPPAVNKSLNVSE
ncbi:MAG: hypothetical protein GY861_17005 [bacterium]|nr:hypothetical protein [bacterium]